MQLHETAMGKSFYEYTMPKIARALDRLTTHGKQELVTPSQIKQKLDEGWIFVAELQDGSVIMEKRG